MAEVATEVIVAGHICLDIRLYHRRLSRRLLAGAFSRRGPEERGGCGSEQRRTGGREQWRALVVAGASAHPCRLGALPCDPRIAGLAGGSRTGYLARTKRAAKSRATENRERTSKRKAGMMMVNQNQGRMLQERTAELLAQQGILLTPQERAAIESQEQIAQSTNHQQLHLAQVIQLALQERR
jgi:hypothetical protein